MEYENLLPKRFVREVGKDKRVIAVLVYGSYVLGKEYRDIDICVVLDKKYQNLEMSDLRVRYGSILPSKFDVHVFQQLPLYVRKGVLEDGKVVFCNDEKALYEIAFQFIKEFNFYEKYYNMYLEKVRNG